MEAIKMNRIILFLSIFIIFPNVAFGQRREREKYPKIHVAEWEKMNQSKQATMEWFKDARFGMFIHWGLYSIPGGIWKGEKIHNMRRPHVAEWIMHAAKIPREEYAELAKQFNPTDFNADEIALLAKDAGMKYIVITSKHHDGFALFDSKVSEYDIMDASPFKRDIIKELHAACKKHGLAFGVYYSQNIDWYDGSDAQSEKRFKENPNISEFEKTFGANTWDPSPNTFEEYLREKAFPQVDELMNQYPDMKLLWYDMDHRMDAEQSFQFYKKVYEKQPQILICERIGNGFGDYLIPGDNTIPVDYESLHKPWETVGTFNNSWGYNSYDNDWKSPEEVLFWLVEIASKGGNYMLNIGPTGTGKVPKESASCLKAIGQWLAVNGDAIYGTERWKISREGPTNINFKSTEDRAEKGFKSAFTSDDFWFTQKGNSIYAISLTKPESSATIEALNTEIGKIKRVEVLGKGKVKFKQSPDGLSISMPKNYLPENGFALKIDL